MLRLASRNATPDDGSHTPADREAVKYWLANTKAEFTPRFVKRLRGWLDSLSHRRTIDVLWDWQRRHLLGVTEEDVKAWDRTRNPGAHGHLIGPAPSRDELQTRLDRFHLVLNLMNRVVLQLMGYRGWYVDYARPGWLEVEFPAAPPEAL